MRGRLALAALLACAGVSSPVAAAGSCAPRDISALEGWKGVWIAEGIRTGISGREAEGAPPVITGMKLLGLDAPWNDEGWRRFEEVLAPGPGGLLKNQGWGFPIIMSSPAPFTFVISPWQTAIISQYREVRQIYTDGRGHPADEDRWPNEWGHAIGCWDGNTLTIDTTDVKYSHHFNHFNAHLSDRARFVERMRLVAPGRIESDITVTDPETLEEPWRVHLAYVPDGDADSVVHDGDTLSNDRTTVEGGGMSIAPPREDGPAIQERPEVKLTEAELDRLVGKYRFNGPPFVLSAERRRDRLFVRVDPPQPFLIPLHPENRLDFFMRGISGSVSFKEDDAGNIVGVTGISPDGMPFSATREK